MKWLIWKDYRHNRLIVFAGLLFLFAPHLIALGVICYAAVHDCPLAQTCKEAFAGSSIYSLILSQLTVALIGGNAIAGERVDRSAEFLASLPLTRRKLISSKLLLSVTIIAAVWLVNAPIIVWLKDVLNLGPDGKDSLIQIFIAIAITGTVLFCVAWCLSSFIASPVFAVCGAFAIPFLLMLTVTVVARLLDAPVTKQTVDFWYPTIFLTLSPLCFALGTWHYLQRAEP